MAADPCRDCADDHAGAAMPLTGYIPERPIREYLMDNDDGKKQAAVAKVDLDADELRRWFDSWCLDRYVARADGRAGWAGSFTPAHVPHTRAGDPLVFMEYNVARLDEEARRELTDPRFALRLRDGRRVIAALVSGTARLAACFRGGEGDGPTHAGVPTNIYLLPQTFVQHKFRQNPHIGRGSSAGGLGTAGKG